MREDGAWCVAMVCCSNVLLFWCRLVGDGTLADCGEAKFVWLCGIRDNLNCVVPLLRLCGLACEKIDCIPSSNP